MATLKTLLISVLKSSQIISTLLKKKYQEWKESVCWQSCCTQEQHLCKLGINYCKQLKVFSFIANQELLLNVKPRFPILPDLKTLYPKILYLELFINFSVASAISPIMARVSGTQIQDLGSTQMCYLLLEKRSNQSKTMLLVIIYFIAIIYLLLTTLAFQRMRTKSFYWESKKAF